jgi:hypothetical protein
LFLVSVALRSVLTSWGICCFSDITYLSRTAPSTSSQPFSPFSVMASRSYREFYGRAGWPDPFAGDYSTFFGRYAPTGTPNAAALLGTFSTTDDQSVFAYLGRDHMVYLAHRMALFTVPFGHPVSQHDGKVIAIRNEITEGGANYLHLTSAFFDAVNVPNVLVAADITYLLIWKMATATATSLPVRCGPLRKQLWRIPHIQWGAACSSIGAAALLVAVSR